MDTHTYMKKTSLSLVIALIAVPAMAQTITDGIMMGRGKLCTGLMYGQENWSTYWEGTLERSNQNIGTLQSRQYLWMGIYGITDRLNVIGSLPYVKNHTTGGTLHDMEGLQDLTLAAKYRFYRLDAEKGRFTAHAVGTFSTPMSNYTPDFLPLSIGLHSTNLSARVTFNYTFRQGWFVNGSSGYTYRSNVVLDRPSYYTNNTFYETNQVRMYDVFDFNLDAGYRIEKWQANLTYMQMNTLGGGDIRRQDMPFVNNMMNASRLGGVLMYYLSKPKDFAVRVTASTVIDGRNVGRSTQWMAGIFYTFHFTKSE